MKLLRVVLVAAVAAMAMAPANAVAEPPANDDFADREVIEGTLPVEVTRSNVEATKEGEGGEGISVFAAGHSVWFEWQAPATEWVTIGACDSDFPAVIGIFTGGSLGSLTKVVSGNPAEGPHCPYSEREYTFKATAGTDYVIGVDGNGFTGPEPVPVETEGEIVLRIESTPPPANDDFADAADLTAAGKIYEFEPEERFYFARLEGYNWGATKETGEPEHEGDPGGASVWYEWTAPATGTVRMSACCFAGPLLGVYTGSSVDALTPLPTESEFPPEVRAQVTGGQTYRIAVDGVFDEATGEATQVWFSVNASMNLPPLPPDQETPNLFEEPPKPQPPQPPETRITGRTLKHRIGLARFRFESTAAGGAFQCKLDKGAFKPCASPKTYRHLKPGRHSFKVRAMDGAGLLDPTAAVGGFRIAAPQRRH
jgi:hypothetical protein